MGERWIALLRGVNVGGSNRLPMAELRATFEAVGLSEVTTYIQSGNVVFDDDAATGDAQQLAARLRSALHDRHGLDVSVVLRTAGEWRRIAEAHPDASSGLDPKFLHVLVLDRPPAPERAGALDHDGFLPDTWALDGREVYVTYPNGSGRSKLTIDVFERAWSVVATGRNLNTVRKLADLADPPADNIG